MSGVEAASPQFKKLGKFEFERTDCPVCGASETAKRYQKTVQGVDVSFGRCAKCSTIYANPRLTVDSLRMLYSSKEFFEGAEDNFNYYSFLAGETYLRRTARGRIERFKALAPGPRLLEIASAAGFFLVEAKNAGFECEGVEFSGPMASYASKRWSVPVSAGSIEETSLAAESYDVVASWGVMTIIRDPKSLIAKIHSALKPGGVWVFNTYDSGSFWGRVFGSRWYILVPNTSQIHSDQTLRRLLRESGFDLVAKRRDRPYASVERLLFVLATHLGDQRVPQKFFDHIHGLNRFVVPAVAPDAFEYVCIKR